MSDSEAGLAWFAQVTGTTDQKCSELWIMSTLHNYFGMGNEFGGYSPGEPTERHLILPIFGTDTGELGIWGWAEAKDRMLEVLKLESREVGEEWLDHIRTLLETERRQALEDVTDIEDREAVIVEFDELKAAVMDTGWLTLFIRDEAIWELKAYVLPY